MFKLYAVRLFCFKHAYIQRDMMECECVSVQQSNDVVSSIFVQRLNFDLDFGFTEAGVYYMMNIFQYQTQKCTHISFVPNICVIHIQPNVVMFFLSLSLSLSFSSQSHNCHIFSSSSPLHV